MTQPATSSPRLAAPPRRLALAICLAAALLGALFALGRGHGDGGPSGPSYLSPPRLAAAEDWLRRTGLPAGFRDDPTYTFCHGLGPCATTVLGPSAALAAMAARLRASGGTLISPQCSGAGGRTTCEQLALRGEIQVGLVDGVLQGPRPRTWLAAVVQNQAPAPQVPPAALPSPGALGLTPLVRGFALRCRTPGSGGCQTLDGHASLPRPPAAVVATVAASVAAHGYAILTNRCRQGTCEVVAVRNLGPHGSRPLFAALLARPSKAAHGGSAVRLVVASQAGPRP